MTDQLSDEQRSLQEEAMRWARTNKKAFAAQFTNPDVFPGELNPVALFMAGSPGAGKTEAAKALVAELGDFLRIDPDEFRAKIPGYDGATSYLVQGAVSVLVGAVLDCAFKQKQSFLLDGTLSSYEVADKNVQRCVDKGRAVQVIYVYQEPHLAWEFVKARELLEGRRIPPDRFVHQFFESRNVVERLKVKYSKDIKIDVVLKNIDGTSGKYLANVQDLKSVVPITHTAAHVLKLVTQEVNGV